MARHWMRYREQRLKAELALDQKIKYSQQSQLQVLLLAVGSCWRRSGNLAFMKMASAEKGVALAL